MSKSNSDKFIRGSDSDGDKRKAKARERQAAILDKMRAQQSKFLASVSSSADEGLDGSNLVQEVSSLDAIHESEEESEQVICSLCHDHNSKSPVSFLILLQKSRLLSLVDRGPPSWYQSEKEPVFTNMPGTSVQSPRSTASSGSEILSSQLMHLIQNVVNELSSDGQPREVNAFLDFIKARFPSVMNIQLPDTLNDTRENTASSLVPLEEHMYLLIQGIMHADLLRSDVVKDAENASAAGGGLTRSDGAKTLLIGKYIASFSKESLGNPSPSGNDSFHNDKPQSKSTMPITAYDGFCPSECDGIYLSSCGHAVHQGCLDSYLSSLKDRK